MRRGIPPFWALLIPLLLLGVVLRVVRPDLVAFKLDEAKFVNIIDAAASGGWPTSGAMSSWGILQPAFRAYLLAPARWVSSDVAAVPALLGMFSFANLVVIGLCAARFSRVAAIAAVGFAAASPWVLHFGRALWDAPIQLFGTLALYAAIRTVQSGDRRWGVAVAPLLVLQALTHLTAWSAVPIAGYLVVRFQAFRGRWFVLGTALGLVLVLPYAAMLLTTAQGLGQPAPAREPWSLGTAWRALQFASWFVSGADLQSLLGVEHAPSYPFSVALAAGPFVAAALMLAGCAASLRSIRGSADTGASEVVVAWVLIPLLATMALPGQLFLHYFQVWGGGAPFVLMGLGAGWLWNRTRQPVIRAAAAGAALSAVLIQAAAWGSLLGYFDSRADTALGPTLGAWQGLTSSARSAASASGSLQVWTDGDSPAFQDKPAVLRLLLGPRIEPVFARGDSMLLREDGPTVFITTPPRAEPRWGFDTLPGLRSLEVTLAGTLWSAGPAPSLAGGLGQVVEFEDGIAYLGSTIRRGAGPNAGQIELATFWRCTRPSVRASTADLTLFVHLEDAEGRRLAQHDGLDWPSDRWAAGVRAAQVTKLDASALRGEGWIRIGLYSRQDLQRSRRLDDGTDSLRIGPVS